VTTLTIAVVVVAVAIVVVSLLIWLIPRRQVQRWRESGVKDPAKLAELSLDARSSVTQAFGGLALVATLAITAYQVSETRRSSEKTLRLAERGQAAERFSNAVEQLGATNANGEPAVDVRTGALFSLRAIALDSKDLAEPAVFTVASYVRNHVPSLEVPERPSVCGENPAPSTDVTTALRLVLTDISEELHANEEDPYAGGLRGAPLNGVRVSRLTLRRFDLTSIGLRCAKLQQADFQHSTLKGAFLQRADLLGADLRGASMVGTKLWKANLESADLRRADLTDANLEGANLANAELKDATFSKRTLKHATLSPKQREEIVVS
jgi:hypothetical protein